MASNITQLAMELDKLKSIYRKSYISDGSRHENSAEHSWHLAVAIMGYARFIPADVDINKCIQMALCHDICEIGAGDVCAYHDTAGKFEEEAQYMNNFSAMFSEFGQHANALWQEYESGMSKESHWVKVFDKLLPFLLNVASQGRTWQEQGITRSMVLEHNAFIGDVAPDILTWMHQEIEQAVSAGWLAPA